MFSVGPKGPYRYEEIHKMQRTAPTFKLSLLIILALFKYACNNTKKNFQSLNAHNINGHFTESKKSEWCNLCRLLLHSEFFKHVYLKSYEMIK